MMPSSPEKAKIDLGKYLTEQEMYIPLRTRLGREGNSYNVSSVYDGAETCETSETISGES